MLRTCGVSRAFCSPRRAGPAYLAGVARLFGRRGDFHNYRRVDCTRHGFTLIELMVVIAIIAMMATIAFRGIINAQRAAQKMACAQQMKDLATAMSLYESNKRAYPGYRNVLTMTDGASYTDPQTPGVGGVSWGVVMLPYIERQDMFDAFCTPPNGNSGSNAGQGGATGPVFAAASAKSRVANYICVSNPPSISGGTPLQYVMNTGCRDADGVPGNGTRAGIPRDWPSNGIGFDLYTGNPRASSRAGGAPVKNDNAVPVVTQSSAWVAGHDGITNTLLLTENVDHGQFTDVYEQALGAIWDIQANVQGPTQIVAGGPMPIAVPKVASYRINNQKGMNAATFAGAPFAANTPYDFARPSSMHIGGANAVFCDTHTVFLSEQMEYFVYCLLMSPDGKTVRVPGQTKPLSANWFRYPLDESFINAP